MACTATSWFSQKPQHYLASAVGRVASIAVTNCQLYQERGGRHPSEVELLMDSKAAITCQPCYYTHHHSVHGCGRHASPLVVPCTVLAGKTTGNRNNYTDSAHQVCFGCSSTTCAAGYTLH